MTSEAGARPSTPPGWSINTFLYGLKGQIDAEAKTISSSASIKN